MPSELVTHDMNGVLDQKVLRVDEVARFLRISPQATYKLIHRGELPARKIGGVFRILDTDLEQYLENGAKYIPNPLPRDPEIIPRRRSARGDSPYRHLKL